MRKALSGYEYAFTVYRTGHTPPFVHLGAGTRVGDLMLVANPPYRMLDANALPWWVSALGGNWLWAPVVKQVGATAQ